MVNSKTESIEYALHRFELGWIDEALDLLEQTLASARSPQDREQAALALGKLYLILNQPAKSLPLLENIDHHDPQVYYKIGLVRRELNQWAQAVSALEKADHLMPEDPKVLTNLGWAYYKNGQAKKGQEFVIRSLRLDHMSIQTLTALAKIYAADKKIYHAAACANRALELDLQNTLSPDSTKALVACQNEFNRHPPLPPKTKNLFEWQDYLSKIWKPGDVLRAAAPVFNPATDLELHQLGDRFMKLWNTSPRPEFGGQTPLEVMNKKLIPSQFKPLQSPKFMSVGIEKAKANTLRQNMVAFLTHLQSNKYSATSARGNLPLKAMYAINELLVKPVKLDNEIGDQVFKPQSSEDIWAFDFLHTLATIGDLAVFQPGRIIKITEQGTAFLESAPNRQLWILFRTWWWQINWLYAYHLISFTDEVMEFLPYMTIDVLRRNPPGKWLHIKDFVAAFIKAGDLKRYAETKHDELIDSAVTKMILLVPAEFDCLELKTKPQITRFSTLDKPYEFRVTDLGYELLASL